MSPNQQADNGTSLLNEWLNPNLHRSPFYGTVYLLAQLMRRRGIDIGWDEDGPIVGKSPLLYLPTVIAALLSANKDFETSFEAAARSFYSPPGCDFGWSGIRNLLEAVGLDLNVLHAFGERPHYPRPAMEARLRKTISREWGTQLSETGMKGYRLTLLLAEELRCWAEEITGKSCNEIADSLSSLWNIERCSNIGVSASVAVQSVKHADILNGLKPTYPQALTGGPSYV